MDYLTGARFETLAVHAGQEPDPQTGSITVPIYQTSTYVQERVGVHRGYEYSRTGNPTRTALEECIAALEEGTHGLAFASGMAAVDTVIRLYPPGSHVLVGNDVYGGTYRLFQRVWQGFGLEFTMVDTADLAAVEEGVQANTRLIWLETPTNPLLRLADIAAVAELCHRHGIDLAVDNTFATPYATKPLSLGADLVIHSTTKYLGGHSDMVGGAVAVRDEERWQRLAFLQNAAGSVPGPLDCWLALRGIKTLAIRLEAHSRNAQAVARFLESHPAIDRVYYPGLASHPQYDLARRQMAVPGGMLSFEFGGSEGDARRLVESTRIFRLAESLGAVESLIELPASMTHLSTQDTPFAIQPNLIRLSVGIEHVDDLLADLEQALAQL